MRARTCLWFRPVFLVPQGFLGSCHLSRALPLSSQALVTTCLPAISTHTLTGISHLFCHIYSTELRAFVPLLSEAAAVSASPQWMQAVPGHSPILISQDLLILLPRSIHFLFPPFLRWSKNIVEPKDFHDPKVVSWGAMVTSPMHSAHSSRSEFPKSKSVSTHFCQEPTGSKNKAKPTIRSSVCEIQGPAICHTLSGPLHTASCDSLMPSFTVQVCSGMTADHNKLLP